jgi:hypothetical protein
MESLPLESFASHTQPEPNTETPAALNSSLNFSNDPNCSLIASANLPFGSPPPSFLNDVK